MPDADLFPASAPARDRFVLERRAARPLHDPWRHQGLIVDEERQEDGRIARAATVFLTGRECPWRCTMCDLWRYTTLTATPPGAIPSQIDAARRALRDDGAAVDVMKLYNAGSFFDPHAVPEADYDRIAGALTGLSRVIVESHPALIGVRVDRFLESLAARSVGAPPALEIAMGLETAHPHALDRLNKRLTVEQFREAALALAGRAAVRVFLLIHPPFVPRGEQDAWLLESIDTAFASGASVVSLIPTRAGNGAMEALAAGGAFRAPDIDDIERSADLALRHAAGRGRVFVDLWDLACVSPCPQCSGTRRERLHQMNLQQVVLPAHACPACVPSVA